MSSIRRRKQGEFVCVCACVCVAVVTGQALIAYRLLSFILLLPDRAKLFQSAPSAGITLPPSPLLNRQLAYNKDNDISPAIQRTSYLIPIYVYTYLTQCRVILANFDDKIITCHNSCVLSQLSIDIILFVYDKSGI